MKLTVSPRIKSGSPLSIGQPTRHAVNIRKLALKEAAKRLDARIKANDPKLSKKVKRAHKANTRNQVVAEID